MIDMPVQENKASWEGYKYCPIHFDSTKNMTVLDFGIFPQNLHINCKRLLISSVPAIM